MTPSPANPSRSPTRRGWCPGVHTPMSSGDGWLLRTRTGCRTVTAAQWRALAESARRFGNGIVELTSRGNVQVRGVQEPDLGEAAALLTSCGLAPVSPAAERARCVVSSPVAGYDATPPASGAETVVGEVESVLEEECFSRLPAKWWAVVDDGGAWPLAGLPCDVRVRSVAGGGWAVELAGMPLGLVDNPTETVLGVARWSARSARRARDLDAMSWRRELRVTEPTPPEPERAAWVGVRALGRAEILVAAPFLGTCTPDDLDLLAALVEAEHVVVRPTTERSVAVCGGSPSAPRACRAALERAGWIVDPGDRRRALSACIGRRGCPASMIDTAAAAGRLLAAGEAERTHLSGCTKACGAPTGVRHLVATGPRSFEVRS